MVQWASDWWQWRTLFLHAAALTVGVAPVVDAVPAPRRRACTWSTTAVVALPLPSPTQQSTVN
jgi:hypothetical protein